MKIKPILFALLITFAAYYGWTHRSSGSTATAELSPTQIQTLAASVIKKGGKLLLKGISLYTSPLRLKLA